MVVVRIKWNYVDIREVRFIGIDEEKSNKGMIVDF